ncbi:MAG: sugar porter family MFS transporter [Mycobacteriaceae bacterium]|nr:sugar porter family MFS transporter [Mycobacteriaceae bacterium]
MSVAERDDRSLPQANTGTRAAPIVAAASGIAALGGLLFGYDTGVVSAALLYIGPAFDLSNDMKQIVVSSLLIGALIGVVVGGPVADRVGRKPTLVTVSVVFACGAIGCAFTPNVPVLLGARFVLGLAIGASSLVVPTYIAEIAPKHNRGALVSLHQLMITVGILVSYLVGYAYSDSEQWRWMLGWAAGPAVLMFIGLFALPESPRWFVAQRRDDEARQVLLRIRTPEEAAAEQAELEQVIHAEAKLSYRDLLGRRYGRWVSVGMVAAATSQFVGVNAVIYYAPTILKEAGFGSSAAILASVGIGTLNVLATVVAVAFIDRLGRRPLILGGASVVIASLVAIGILFLFPLRGAVGIGLVAMLIVYQSAFAVSLGMGIWLSNSELYPTSVRGKAASLGIASHWGPDLMVSVSVLTLISWITATGVFWLYAAVGAVGVLYLRKWLPETKNRSLEEIEADLAERSTG